MLGQYDSLIRYSLGQKNCVRLVMVEGSNSNFGTQNYVRLQWYVVEVSLFFFKESIQWLLGSFNGLVHSSVAVVIS